MSVRVVLRAIPYDIKREIVVFVMSLDVFTAAYAARLFLNLAFS